MKASPYSKFGTTASSSRDGALSPAREQDTTFIPKIIRRNTDERGLLLDEPTGVRDVRLEVGASYARSAGVAHNVINANAYNFRFVEIEVI
jgi:hypothetical protein